ncbi:hypothetical protein SLA_6537 [Streptomyces laurentii]|uniref:Uncharacterized protein n=1 Tax=Streptomyces laurentii TaxID=39478 RepID=A0A160P8X9_STRLU|nr:hypothetical protein SLA_6537 [Streptomyces laurentii]
MRTEAPNGDGAHLRGMSPLRRLSRRIRVPRVRWTSALGTACYPVRDIDLFIEESQTWWVTTTSPGEIRT